MPAQARHTGQDQGWAWVVLGAAVASNVLLTLTQIGGFFNLIFLDVFDKSKETTAWVIATMVGSKYILAPAYSIMLNKIGVRWTIITGGIISTVGYLWCGLVTEFNQLFFAFGISMGCGIGMIYIATNVVVGKYFQKYRVLAYGITGTGAGIAAMAFPPIIDLLVEHRGWRETFIIIAGLNLQFCVIGALMRPLPSTCPVKERDTDECEHKDEVKNSSDAATALLERLSSEVECEHKDEVKNSSDAANALLERPISVMECDLKDEENNSSGAAAIALIEIPSIAVECDDGSIETRDPQLESTDNTEDPDVSIREPLKDAKLYDEPPDQSFCSRCCMHLTSSPTAKVMFGKPFLSFFMAAFLCTGAYQIMVVHFPAFAAFHGTSQRDVSYLLLLHGLSQTMGKMIIAAAANHSQDIILWSISGCGLTGTIVFLCPSLATTFTTQAILLSLHGFYLNMATTLFMPLLIYVCGGTDHLATGVGVIGVAFGLAGLLFPPLGGWMRDNSGNYQGTLYTAGGLWLLGLVFMSAIVIFKGKPKRTASEEV